MANLALAFAELLAGGLLAVAGATGNPIEDVIAGDTTLNPFSGSPSTSSSTSTAGGAGAAITTPPPGNAPAKVKAMIAQADALVGTPYVWGGGHSASAFTDSIATLRAAGLDCSGFVSRVLHSGGYLTSPQSTETLPSNLASGPGQWVTVWDDAAEHTIIDLDGTFYQAPHTGADVQEISDSEAQSIIQSMGMVAYHPAGL